LTPSRCDPAALIGDSLLSIFVSFPPSNLEQHFCCILLFYKHAPKNEKVLLQEARQCIEDCADSAESDDFDEEAVTAMEAVEEACSSFGEIIDDLEGAEKLSDPYPFGVVKRSDFVRLSQGMKVQKLKEELAMIVREWRSPPEMRPAD